MAELSIPELIRTQALSRGVDPEVALRIAERESSLDPTAKNRRSSAYGLFQVTDDTWKQYGGDPAKRRDLQENVRVGLDVIASNRDTYIRQFGREPAPGELYTMHFLGRTGGPKLLKADPNQSVASVVSPQVLKANPDIKGKTVGEFIASMQQKMGAPKAAATAVARTEGPVSMPTSPKETMQRPQRPRIEPLAEGPMTRDMLASLGPNYQAALAAVTLGDSREDEDEESLAEQYAARQEEESVPRSTALAGLDLSYQSPFEEPVQQFRHGGIVHRADGSPRQGERAYEGTIFPYADEGKAKKALEEYTRLVSDKESIQQFTPELLIRGETLRKQAMDPVSIRLARETALESPRYQGDPYLPRAVTAKSPVTLFAGIPGAQVVDMAPLKDTTLGGFVFDRGAMEEARREGKNLSDVIFMAPPKSRRVQEILEMTPGQVATDRQMTLAHEAEHLLARRGLVDPNKPNIEGPHPINSTFDTLVDSRTARGTFVRNVAGIKDYLTKKYDVHLPAYFSRSRPEEFHEQIATLSAIEQVKNVDLTQDPELRKTLFKDPTTRKAYRAITGLRQTRLDARDLPPYTMQPEPGETTASQGALDFIRSQLESTKEGLITAKDKFARMFKEGVPQQQQVRPLNKADGGYIDPYGMDTGPVTADTRKALSTRQGLSAAELMRMLKGVGREGVSNLESLARGSVSAVPGLVGDVESIFRTDKERRFATTPEVERQYLPKRMTAPTKESAGFVELGTFIDPTIAGKVARPVAQGTAKAALAGFKSVSPQLENIMEKSALGLDKSYIVKPEGGNWAPSLKSGGVETDSANKFTDRFLEERGIELTDLSAAERALLRSEKRIKELQERIKGREDYIISRTGKGEEDLLEYEKGMLVQDQQYLDEYTRNYNVDVSEVAQSKALNAFIQNKLNPYFRNKFGTASDPIRLQVDKFQLEEKPKLIAEKQRQIDKIKADIDQKAGEAGVDPLVLTNSQERLRKLERELESIRSRTGAFFQPDPTAETAASILRSSTKIDNKRSRAFGKEGAIKDFIKGKSDEAISWENRSDELIGVKDPIEAFDDFVYMYPDERPPSGFLKAMEKNEPIYYFPNSAGFWRATNDIQHMIDEVSNALNPQSGLPSELRVTGEKLQKMSVEDVSRLVDKINGWRASFEGQIDPARANNAAVFKAKNYSVIPNTDAPNTKGFHWVEIKPPTGMSKEKAREALNDALLYEGEMMKHCVGAYCPDVEEGTRIFSLRDAEGRPYTTIELNPDIPDAIETIEEFTQRRGMNTWGASDNEILEEVQRLGFAVPYKIDQIKGIKNTRPVEEAFPFIKDFINNPVMNMNWTGMSNDAILFSNY